MPFSNRKGTKHAIHSRTRRGRALWGAVTQPAHVRTPLMSVSGLLLTKFAVGANSAVHHRLAFHDVGTPPFGFRIKLYGQALLALNKARRLRPHWLAES